MLPNTKTVSRKVLSFPLTVIAAVLCISGSASATFPGQNGKLVFSSTLDGNYDVYSTNPDGSDLVNLTNDPGSDMIPAWSPDGTRIAFSSSRDGDLDIYTMNADGSGVTNVTNDSFSFDSMPTWSPDGTQLAFSSNRDGNVDIHLVSADGTGPITQLTETNAPASNAAESWSPDGTRIAFASTRDDDPSDAVLDHEVYLMNADGSNETNIFNRPSTDDGGPSWSPDSSQIVFHSAHEGNNEIYKQNVAGLAVTGSPIRLTNSSQNDVAPTWSPDNSQIAFAHGSPSGSYDVYVMNSDGSSQANLTDNDSSATPTIETWPDWQPIVDTSVSPDVPTAGQADSSSSSTGFEAGSPATATLSDPIPDITSLSIDRRFVLTKKSTPLTASVAGTRTVQRGTVIRYGLSEAATVKFTFHRRRAGRKLKTGSGSTKSRCVLNTPRNRKRLSKRLGSRCVRLDRLQATLARSGSEGDNRLVFTGRLGRRALRPGTYRVRAIATDATGQVSKPKQRTFRVMPRR